MKKFALTFVLIGIMLLSYHLGQAQQWIGNNNTTDPIRRTGNVAIGDANGLLGNFSVVKTTDHAGFTLEAGNQKNPYFDFLEGGVLRNSTYWDGPADVFRFRNFGSFPFIFSVFTTSEIELMRIKGDGNVGIGTSLANNPNNYKLAVKGKIGAQEVQVENTSTTWADYVFEPDYKLLSLSEVEKFVKLNKHLPEIPSAEEIRINGHKLGEMDVLLLKKVEELTLYVIELRKEIEEIKKKNEQLMSKPKN